MGQLTIRTRMVVGFFAAILASGADAQTTNVDRGEQAGELAPAAQVDEAPSATKLQLIRRFLVLNGTQAEIDSGSFLDRYGLSVRFEGPEEGWTFFDRLSKPIEALRRAYEPHRPEYQEAFESHVNWEFTEDELTEIVAFLETPTGRHFLDGRWRMGAYTDTFMEEVTEQIILQAQRDVKGAE